MIISSFFSFSSKTLTFIYMHNGKCCSFPCKIFTEISPRLARSRRDRRDLVEIDEISPRLQRSRRDLAMIFVGFYIAVRSRRDMFHLAEIAENSPRLPRCHRDCRDLAMTFVKF